MDTFKTAQMPKCCMHCGQDVNNGQRRAVRSGWIWHAMCAIETNGPPPFYYQIRVKWA
jgi:hypothetical protein